MRDQNHTITAARSHSKCAILPVLPRPQPLPSLQTCRLRAGKVGQAACGMSEGKYNLRDGRHPDSLQGHSTLSEPSSAAVLQHQAPQQSSPRPAFIREHLYSPTRRHSPPQPCDESRGAAVPRPPPLLGRLPPAALRSRCSGHRSRAAILFLSALANFANATKTRRSHLSHHISL